MLAAAEGPANARTVQADFPGSLHNILFRADGRLAFGALENLRAGIYSVAADGGDLRADHAAATFAPGSLGVGSFTKFTMAFSADGSRVASMVSGPREPANVIAGPWRGELTRRTALNSAVADVALGGVEEISWRAADGLAIHGFLVKPANFDAKKKYPLVVEVHGGPRRSWWATCFLNNSHWAQWLAQQGYVVLMPNPRGSEGRGAEFVRGNRKDLGGGDWRDIVAGLNHVLTLGFVDPERLALVGWSYGGYLTAWGITQPEGRVFKAAVVGAGITNIFARGGAAGGWGENHWGDPLALWKEPLEFFRRSPIAHVNQVRAATLILHGDADTKVPHGQAVDFFTALQALGVPSEARLYPGEGHGIVRREHRLDLLNSIARWLKTYVPPDAR
jgi:dipeptidyl aminopeptidase/acylaminoacyl peptidase